MSKQMIIDYILPVLVFILFLTIARIVYLSWDRSLWKKDEKYYGELMPMGGFTYAVACTICKNGPYTDGVCGECICEARSHFELKPGAARILEEMRSE